MQLILYTITQTAFEHLFAPMRKGYGKPDRAGCTLSLSGLVPWWN